MTEKQIRDAYCKIRTIDNTIPDDVLDFMKDCAIEKIGAEQESRASLIIDFAKKVIRYPKGSSGYDPSDIMNLQFWIEKYEEKKHDSVKNILFR